jgi:hypothetical protein
MAVVHKGEITSSSVHIEGNNYRYDIYPHGVGEGAGLQTSHILLDPDTHELVPVRVENIHIGCGETVILATGDELTGA